jgi:hypothetical protein
MRIANADRPVASVGRGRIHSKKIKVIQEVGNAKIVAHRSQQMHGLSAVRDGVFVREPWGIQHLEIADQGFQL